MTRMSGSASPTIPKMQGYSIHGEIYVREVDCRRAVSAALAIGPNASLLAALKSLHADCVEYARINNLHNSDGSPATHHSMRQALAAIEKAEGRP